MYECMYVDQITEKKNNPNKNQLDWSVLDYTTMV